MPATMQLDATRRALELEQAVGATVVVASTSSHLAAVVEHHNQHAGATRHETPSAYMVTRWRGIRHGHL